jgi:hypothetical protein
MRCVRNLLETLIVLLSKLLCRFNGSVRMAPKRSHLRNCSQNGAWGRSPRFHRGRNQASLLGWLGGGVFGGRPHVLPVAIAIRAVQRRAIVMANPLYPPLSGSDIKRARGTHQHPPAVNVRVLALRHRGAHQVARLEAFDSSALFGLAAWKPETVHVPDLAATMPLCSNEQGNDASDAKIIRGTRADTRRIEPMRFGQAAPAPIELRQAAADLWVFHRLRIEPDEFLGNGGHRTEPHQQPRPRQDIAEATF